MLFSELYKTIVNKVTFLDFRGEMIPIAPLDPLLVEHRKCAAGLVTHTPVCKIESCETTQLRMRIKYTRKFNFFCHV